MHDHAGVVGDDPLAGREAVHGERLDVVVFLQAIAQFAGDGLEVRLGGAGTNDEEIREGGNATEVDGHDVFGFFLGDDLGAEAGEGVRFDGAGPGKGDGR